MSKKITVAYGDGIGPEIMTASLDILRAAGARIEEDVIEIGEKVYREGHTSGIRAEDWKKLVDNEIFYKAPITTPQGGGYKSLNVTIRKTLGLFANVRPIKSLSPFVKTRHPGLDTVIVRENEEDLYAGIEHRQTDEVYQCLKLITRPGCEKIIRYAFEYARNAGRRKITCMTKDNIMKLTDGLFHQVFDEVARDYPEIETEHWIIDIGVARYADTPEDFDVIVTLNLYGDILSDVAAQLAGSVGMAGSINVGATCSMFEAIHGSAPTIAGQNVANPSGLLMAGVEMLNHIGQNDVAEKVANAWLRTIEDGIHTADIFTEGESRQKASTSDFASAVIERLGSTPQRFDVIRYPKKAEALQFEYSPAPAATKTLHGIDVFICEADRNPESLGQRLEEATGTHSLSLQMITNRGVKVYPGGNPHTFCTDHWRCRFAAEGGKEVSPDELWSLLQALSSAGLEVIKTENLYQFDGEPGYSLGQGQ